MSRYRALWGVYHANGGLLGELAYFVGKLRGTSHCALCDITHGALTKKPAFKALERELRMPVQLVHLNEQSEALAAVTQGQTPCIVGETDSRLDLLLGPAALEACNGSVNAFRQALQSRLSGASSPEGT